MRTDFYLGPPEEYELLNKSGCIEIDGVDDGADFREVLVCKPLRKKYFLQKIIIKQLY